jgi:hypothetical protein
MFHFDYLLDCLWFAVAESKVGDGGNGKCSLLHLRIKKRKETRQKSCTKWLDGPNISVAQLSPLGSPIATGTCAENQVVGSTFASESFSFSALIQSPTCTREPGSRVPLPPQLLPF